MTIYEERQAQQVRWERYREAALRLFPGVSLTHHECCVNENADKTCAYIEVTVCIPRSAIEPAATEDDALIVVEQL